MEERSSSTSTLQQRLQQRRDRFFNEGLSSSVTPTTFASRIGSSHVTTPTMAPPPQPPPTTPRTLKETPNLKKENKLEMNGGMEALKKYSSMDSSSSLFAAKPEIFSKPEVPAKPANRYPTTSPPAPSAIIPRPPIAKPENTNWSEKPLALEGYVGFANLPNQVYRKAVKRGFDFNLMVVGESGLGKSTLINSMFLTDIYSTEFPGPSQRLKKTVQVETSKVLLNESGVSLTLTIVDTPGFGDAVDNSNCWDPVIQYIESQYESFLDAETRVNRVSLPDSRVHCCLYFIAPSGHGLKPLDVEFMKRLHDKVNIIPVIAKSDTMVPEEIEYFKKQIMNQILQYKIKIYEFPDYDGEEDNERKENQILKDRVPFAVVGSNTILETSEGKKVRGRKYPWGIVQIESMEHCDFVPLRNMLIRSHLQDLKEVTNIIHYENYRCKKLAGVTGNTSEKIPNKNPLAQIEEERRDHQNKLEKMEKEMEDVFERKVREKRQKLADSRADLEKRHLESKEKLEQQKKEFEARKNAFLAEKSAWEALHRVSIADLKRLSLDSLDSNKKKKGVLSGMSFRNGR